MKFVAFSTILLSSLVAARPSLRQRAANATTSATSPVTPIPTSTAVGSPGTNTTNSTNPQTSLTLLSSLVAPGFAQNGSGTNTSEAGEVPSLTSPNNFINWCATIPNLPITNGQQLHNGSCNPAPMGAIPSVSNMPSAKFVTPANLAVIPANTTFQITLAVKNLATGFFVNADTNFLAAPQQLNATTGQIQGHAHIVIESLESLVQTTPTDPTKFAFFAAMNGKADTLGQLYANVTGGLPVGFYKMSTILAAMNHQPVLLPVAQHGSSNDVIYLTVVAPTGGMNSTTVPTVVPTGTSLPTQPPNTSQPSLASQLTPTSKPTNTLQSVPTSQPTHTSQPATTGTPAPTGTASAGVISEC